jgi:glycerate 2-kinase
MSTPRDDVLKIFRAALAAVHGTACVERFLTVRRLQGEVYAVAVGKAAEAMLQGARSALGGQLRSALLVTKPGYVTSAVKSIPAMTVIEAGHPVPDEASLRAGQAVLDFIAATPNDAQLLFLISGGASSLVEILPQGVSLGDLRRANQWLLDSGLDIRNMNALRKRLSCIKGGRLAAHLRGRNVLQVLISDVPGDSPADIGSGLLVPEEEGHTAVPPPPVWLQVLLNHSPPQVTDPSYFLNIDTHVVASLDHALAAAALETKKLGYKLQVHTERLSGDAALAGRLLAGVLIDGPPSVHIWGGETGVALPPDPGRGGRNQHLALAAAEVLANRNNVWLLAAGTDGSDGMGGDAGSLVDGGTIPRGTMKCMNAADCLRRADAGSFLEKSGDLLSTGPTGTNVMDIVIGMKKL